MVKYLIATGWPIIFLILSSACNRVEEEKSTSKSAEHCADPRTFESYYALAEKCGTLGPVHSFSGTIALGFEVSTFREGKSLDLSILKPDKNDYYLLIPDSLKSEINQRNEGNPTIAYVEFRGRTTDVTSPTGNSAILVMDFVHIWYHD